MAVHRRSARGQAPDPFTRHRRRADRPRARCRPASPPHRQGVRPPKRGGDRTVASLPGPARQRRITARCQQGSPSSRMPHPAGDKRRQCRNQGVSGRPACLRPRQAMNGHGRGNESSRRGRIEPGANPRASGRSSSNGPGKSNSACNWSNRPGCGRSGSRLSRYVPAPWFRVFPSPPHPLSSRAPTSTGQADSSRRQLFPGLPREVAFQPHGCRPPSRAPRSHPWHCRSNPRRALQRRTPRR